MRKYLFLLLLVSFGLVIVTGCAAIPKGDYDDITDELGDPDPSGTKEPGDNEGNHQIQPNQLTAAVWNDQKHYDFWLSLFKSTQNSPDGIFTTYYNEGFFDTMNLIEVTITSNEEAVSGAKVILKEGETPVYQAVTNRLGIAYLYPKTDTLSQLTKITIETSTGVKDFDFTYTLPEEDSHVKVTYDLSTTNTIEDRLEIMFVIDTTGSMGDEIRYLQVEIEDVIQKIADLNPMTEILLALLFYRDHGDTYLTRYFDFTTNIAEQKANLLRQGADGGGDYEEAVDKALDEAVNQRWSSGNSTKIIVHVLDAPPHTNNKQVMDLYTSSVLKASAKGIRIIPVASSGVDRRTEYLLRCQAMLTGGDYIYLTNDSGIGGEHLEPTVGEKVVEYLNQLLVRIINEHHTGIPTEPVPYYQDNQQ